MKKIRKDFAKNVFDKRKMKRFLNRRTFNAVMQAQQTGKVVSPTVAESFAKGLQRWALSAGVDRFTHWFQPLNNFTAGKRDSLSSVNEEGNAILKFRGKELQKGEGDASSFPNGGIRQTFEARGITQWDCTSNAFVRNGCLCIPTTFSSFTGETLDKKTPLLRSIATLNTQALRLLKLLGFSHTRVTAVVGAEQEYFLVDKNLFLQRPDLVFTGRTLFGNPPPKGQELNDHYYSPPNDRTVKFWQEADDELWKLGIIVKTEHKEVAPCQFELAPCYSPVNIACDQNRLITQVLQSVADKFGLVCLLHEKPFEKINGSGKHNNWSLLTENGCNLFEQGKTATEHARFLLFATCIIMAVDLHQDLLSYSVSSAANDCRLGGYEAPPQIISLFFGNLHKTLKRTLADENWHLGTDLLPLHTEATDRNRTSPFAFTGNKFEFRMVGSSASLADCNTVLNTIVADALKYFADNLEHSQNFWEDAKNLARTVFLRHEKILFEGNNYSPDWQTEAQNRKLLNITSTPKAVSCLTEQKNVQLFERHNIYNERELQALQQILQENYFNTVIIEANTLLEMCTKQIVPTLQRYVSIVAQTATAKQELALEHTTETNLCKKASLLANRIVWHTRRLKKQTEVGKNLPDFTQKAEFCCDIINVTLQRLRTIIDQAEAICPSDLWPFPTNAQLLSEH